ncbi:Lrp/AsnC family transcriptional regulator [Streptomyces sp. NPDC096198]|uniref:Lrp/AsnC family transcriptional regulator n=1 Tax=Streptomyces sp. NPDC096198 TaxID=3366080 RepID=UPI0038090521
MNGGVDGVGGGPSGAEAEDRAPRHIAQRRHGGVLASLIRGYRALIDPAAVGRSLRVFAGVRLMRHTRADVIAFERGITQLPQVAACHHITGNFDYLLQVDIADLPAYEDFYANQLAALPGVATVTSYVTMKTLSPDTA